MIQIKKTILTLVALLAVTTGALGAKVSKITIDDAYYQKIGSDYKIIVTGYVRDMDDNDINKGTVSIYLNDEKKGECDAEFGQFSCEVDVGPGSYNVGVRYHDDSGDYLDSQNNYYDNPIIIKAPDPVTWYVDGTKPYGNDGKSEADAFSTLNEALFAASNNDTVKIAAGTYAGISNTGVYIQKILTFEKYGDGEVIFDGQGQGTIWSVGVNTINIYGLTFINGGGDKGGALYFLYDLSNSVINATFRDNSVNIYGGAIYVDNSVSNLTLRSTFINNTANESGAAVYIKSTASNLTVNSTFIGNNSGNSIIYIGNSVSGNSIQNSVFLNNEAYKIFSVNDGEITAKDNWFGSNATDYYKIPDDVGIDLENWLFLNATADPSELAADETSTIIFKLSSFDGSEISDYDASNMNVVLELSQTLGELNKNTTLIGEEVIYTAKQEGNASVTGKVGNVEYTIPIKISTTGPEVAWNKAEKTGTFVMPAFDVEIVPIYAPVAQWAVVENVQQLPTAIEGIYTESTDAIVKAGTVAKIGETENLQGEVMYAVGTSATEQPALTAFSATLPTAKDITTAGDVYVWYYIKGVDAPDGTEATAENTFNDSEICAEPIKVTVLSNKFNIQFTAANANTIEAGKATVTVGGTAATVTEGKLESVKMGSEVKVKANEGYKFRKVEVKKAGPKTITIDDVVLVYEDGDTWEKIKDRNPGKVECSTYVFIKGSVVLLNSSPVSQTDVIVPNGVYTLGLT